MDRQSLEHLLVPITADGDPTDYPVRIALLPNGERPEEADWHTGSWVTEDGVHYARLLIGPGGDVEPEPGAYRVWTEITAPPEKPVLMSPRFWIV